MYQPIEHVYSLLLSPSHMRGDLPRNVKDCTQTQSQVVVVWKEC
jgi:hypothetical protein